MKIMGIIFLIMKISVCSHKLFRFHITFYFHLFFYTTARYSVYVNCFSINKPRESEIEVKNLINPRNSGGMFCWPYSLFSWSKSSRNLLQSLPVSSCPSLLFSPVPLYPTSSVFFMAHPSQQIVDSVLDWRCLYWPSKVAVWAILPQQWGLTKKKMGPDIKSEILTLPSSPRLLTLGAQQEINWDRAQQGREDNY